MNKYNVETQLYGDCLYEIKRRIDVIVDHINKKTVEKYLIIEVETVCLQFRKILEKIALMSLVANKELYAKENDKFAKHYHAERIFNDLEKINPDFYPVPIKRIKVQEDNYEIVENDNGSLTKDEFIKIYEKCGGILHAQNPFSTQKNLHEIKECFSEWLNKICCLISHHKITLGGGKLLVIGLLETKQTGFPQVVIYELEEN